MTAGGKIYVIGAGLAGLSAATHLAAAGRKVIVLEGAGQAGGRCRSYFDSGLGQVIDNGNHLVLSGNHNVRRYLTRIGSLDKVRGPRRAQFDFVDIQEGRKWVVAPNAGPIPWWINSASRRVPGTTPRDYAEYAKLLWAGRDKKISDVVACKGALWDRLMRPFLLAALNTDPPEASAALAGAVLRETLARGGRACRPRIAMPSLAAAFVDPALAYLERAGAEVRLGARLRAIVMGPHAAIALEFPDTTIALDKADRVILAVPLAAAADLLPGLDVPAESRAILNAHFKCPAPPNAPMMVGVLGSVAEWVFAFEDRISVTVSGADALMDQDREELAKILWRDVALALNLGAQSPPPQWQIVKEKRATFAATPQEDAKRPSARTQWRNLVLAGDWTQTGLPATIEGALRSGETAANLL